MNIDERYSGQTDLVTESWPLGQARQKPGV